MVSLQAVVLTRGTSHSWCLPSQEGVLHYGPYKEPLIPSTFFPPFTPPPWDHSPAPPPPPLGMPWWDPLATGHLASGEGVTHLAPLCAGSRGRASTAALAKLRANPCCRVAKPSPASAHQQKCLHDPSSIFLGCAEPLTPCAAL